MSISNVKKVYSEMLKIEEDSNYCVPFHKYYILNLTVDLSSTKNKDTKSKNAGKVSSNIQLDLDSLAKKLLSRNIEHQPLSVYIFNNNISLIFSCSEENENHYKNGSYQKIISEYVSSLSRELNRNVDGSIVELESKTTVITYFIWKVHSNSFNYMIENSEGVVSINDTKAKTLGELINVLQTVNIIWDDVNSKDKYGIFYKLKKKKNTIIIDSLSEFLDSRNIKSYITFIFNK
jgi:hypothetical protein